MCQTLGSLVCLDVIGSFVSFLVIGSIIGLTICFIFEKECL